MGFLFAMGLLSLGAAAWPIYLHFFRRHRVVQVVPSLRLFGFARKHSRRANIEQLLLLLARVLIVGSLALLLGQPYLESARELPLPLAAGEAPASMELAVVVDDSLSAVAGQGQDNRLVQGKAWLRRQLAALPPTARVRITPTSAAHPSAPLNPEEALAFVDALQPLPYAGDAAEALANLLPRLGGDQTCIAVVAPRLQELWPAYAAVDGPPLPVQFLDTTQWRNQLIVHQVQRATEAAATAGWECRFSGASEAIGGSQLTVEGGEERLATVTITPHDALRGRVLFDVPESSRQPAFRLRGGAVDGHPWHSWYFRSGAAPALGPRQAMIVRQRTDAGLLADHILTAVILSTRPEVAIQHVAPADVGELPAAGVVILVGDVAAEGLEAWLTARGAAGRRVLCVPTTAGAVPTGGIVPAYGAPVDLLRASVNPLSLGDQTAFWPAGLEELLLAGRQDLTPQRLVPPTTDEQLTPVVATAGGQPLLAGRPFPGGNSLWALGIPLDLTEGNAVFHPLVPLILAEIMLPSGIVEGGTEFSATVGRPADLLRWFDLDQVDGVLVYPDGQQLSVRGAAGRPLFVNLTRAGVYELRLGERTRYRVANYPRLPTATELPREEWEAAHPDLQVTWLKPMDDLGPEDYGPTGRQAAMRETLRYDLTPVAVALLGLWLLLEVAALLLVWRRREA